MPFFRIEGQDLVSGPQIFGPGYSLLEEKKDSYAYPVHGWTWFATAEEAASVLVLKKPTVLTVSRRQAELAMWQSGVLDIVEQVVATQPRDVQISYNRASEFKRDDPMLNAVCKYVLNWSDEQVDDLFARAASIPN